MMYKMSQQFPDEVLRYDLYEKQRATIEAQLGLDSLRDNAVLVQFIVNSIIWLPEAEKYTLKQALEVQQNVRATLIEFGERYDHFETRMGEYYDVNEDWALGELPVAEMKAFYNNADAGEVMQGRDVHETSIVNHEPVTATTNAYKYILRKKLDWQT